MSTQEEDQTVRQHADEIEENSLRIDADRAEQIIEALNTDLANAYVLYHQLKKHHWTVEGAEFLELHRFLEEAYEHVEEGADMIAERAQALGGVPVSGMEALSDRATVEHEGEDVYDIRTSLENDLEMYGDIIEDLRDHIELADNLGDYTTEDILQHDVLKKVEEDAHHIEHYLEDDTLVLEEATH